MRLIIFCILFCGGLTPSATGQIIQDHPELCGKTDDYVPVPSNVFATLDSSGGEATVFFKTADSVKGVAIPGVTDEIEEVCPIAANRLIVFGNASSVTHNVAIIDGSKALLLDSFYGTSPRMSPNQQWLVYGKFYSRGALAPSDEYLLYDLRKTRTENRPKGIEVTDRTDVGRAIYPLGQKNLLADNIGLPDEQVHNAHSSFFWSPDSTAIVFADSVQGKLSIVLVTLDSDTSSSAFISPPISCSDSCSCGGSAIVKKAEVTSPLPDGERRIRVEFFSPVGCATPLELRAKDLQPAKEEVHKPVQPRRRAVVRDR